MSNNVKKKSFFFKKKCVYVLYTFLKKGFTSTFLSCLMLLGTILSKCSHKKLASLSILTLIYFPDDKYKTYSHFFPQTKKGSKRN